MAVLPGTGRAFTLVELLAVVSIGLVMLALLVPAVSTMQEKGREATCVANLRELAAGCILYGQDKDGRLPYNTGTDEESGSGWHSLIYLYIGTDGKSNWADSTNLNKNRYYRCKSDKEPYQGKLSYGFNRYLRDVRFQSFAKSLPMLAESKNFSFDETTNQPVEYRHRKGANIAFTDGRVEWHTQTNITKEFLERPFE